jgi:hypothetical protein
VEATYSIIFDVVQLYLIMSQDEPADGPTGEYREETVKKLERENEVDTTDRDTSNESVA